MTTLLDLARLAEAVYDVSPALYGWRRIDIVRAAGHLHGFQAAAFGRGGNVVVAFRGTSQAADGIADLKLGSGMNTSYFDAGESFVDAIQGRFNIVVTGHSLGGAIAQVVANRRGLVMATFNAPGVGVVASRNIGRSTPFMNVVRTRGMLLSTVLHPVQAAKDARYAFRPVRGVNLCLTGDVVSLIGNHYGKVIRIPGTGGSPLTEHKIATVIKTLERESNRSLANSTPLSV